MPSWTENSANNPSRYDNQANTTELQKNVRVYIAKDGIGHSQFEYQKQSIHIQTAEDLICKNRAGRRIISATAVECWVGLETSNSLNDILSPRQDLR